MKTHRGNSHFGNRRFAGDLRLCTNCMTPTSGRVCYSCSREHQEKYGMRTYADPQEKRVKTNVKPGKLIRVISDSTILSSLPDNFMSDGNVITGRIERTEVGVVLAICDIQHTDGDLVEEMLVMFPGGVGWNACDCFVEVGDE